MLDRRWRARPPWHRTLIRIAWFALIVATFTLVMALLLNR
jgi:hypothetical protein